MALDAPLPCFDGELPATLLLGDALEARQPEAADHASFAVMAPVEDAQHLAGELAGLGHAHEVILQHPRALFAQARAAKVRAARLRLIVFFHCRVDRLHELVSKGVFGGAVEVEHQ